MHHHKIKLFTCELTVTGPCYTMGPVQLTVQDPYKIFLLTNYRKSGIIKGTAAAEMLMHSMLNFLRFYLYKPTCHIEATAVDDSVEQIRQCHRNNHQKTCNDI